MIFNGRRQFPFLALAWFVGAAAPCSPQQAQSSPNADTTVFGTDGAARITRVIPVPRTVSPEAQARLATGATWAPGPNSPENAKLIEKAREMYPVKEEEATIAGVKVRYFTPSEIPASKRNRLLINLHGGGFQTDASSFLESIPIASMTKSRVVSVYYRMAPKYVFPAPVDDVVAVYKEILKTHNPRNLVIYGTSAGAILTAQVAVRLKLDGVPLPAALGFFSGMTDFTRTGDSHAFFAVPGLMGARVPEPESSRPYMKGHDPHDPLASPIFADLHELPPTLCITGTRDEFLSSTSIFHRALLRAGVDAELVVFEAMSHAHWFMIGIPEATEAFETMANFFDRKLDDASRH